MIPSPEVIARLSLEFAVLCDPSGAVLSADHRAQQRLRVVPGGAFTDLCVTGTTAKAQELTRKATASVVGLELSLAAVGQPRESGMETRL